MTEQSSSRPPAAHRSRSPTASSTCPTTRSFPSSKATAPAPTSGAPSVRVLDAAVEKAYGGKRKIHWMEVLAGEKAFNQTGNWLPDETVEAFRKYLVGIKGPLTTPVGGGIRSLNVALRQMLDLYVCLRPVRWFKGVPSPVQGSGEGRHGRSSARTPRTSTPASNSRKARDDAKKFAALLKEHFPERYKKIRFPETSGIGIKPVSREGTERLVRAAIEYAIDNERKSGDARAQGQHHEVHRRRVPRLGLCARAEGVRRGRDRRRSVDARSRIRRPARTSSSRTRSPMRSCSRSCCVRPSTTSSRR